MSKNDEEIAFVNALKAVDVMKEEEYMSALRDLAEVMFDMTDQDFENNCTTSKSCD